MHSKNLKVIVWVGLLVLCLSSAAWSKNPMLPKAGKKKAASESTESISLPANLNAADIDRIMAGLSDEQVRRLLLNELKTLAQQEALERGAAAKPGGIAIFIVAALTLFSLFLDRTAGQRVLLAAYLAGFAIPPAHGTDLCYLLGQYDHRRDSPGGCH